MNAVNIHEAKTRLSQLVVEAERGERIVISRAGHPVAQLVSIRATEQADARPTGFLRGQIRVPDDFDRWGSDDIAGLFDGANEPRFAEDLNAEARHSTECSDEAPA